MIEHIIPQAHSGLVGGSTAARRIGCPRSFALEQRVPSAGHSSVHALEGSALHDLMAVALARDLEPTTLLPFTYVEQGTDARFVVDHALWLDKGEPALRAFDVFVAEQETRLGAPMRFQIETRVVFPGVPNAFGTSDIIAHCGDEMFVMDWKFGRRIVPAAENQQLMFYAVAALATVGDFFEHVTLVAETPVTLVILQPAAPVGIDVWRTNLQRLQVFEAELQTAVQMIREQGVNAPVKDGPWCEFARCKSVCPVHLGAVTSLASRFEALKGAIEGKAPPNDWSEQLADLLALADMAEDWAREVRNQAHQSAERGVAIPGWVLETGRKGPRKWAIEDAQVVRIFTGPDFGLTENEVAPRVVLTLPALEKILKRNKQSVPENLVCQTEPTTTRLVRVENATEVVHPIAARAQALADRVMML